MRHLTDRPTVCTAKTASRRLRGLIEGRIHGMHVMEDLRPPIFPLVEIEGRLQGSVVEYRQHHLASIDLGIAELQARVSRFSGDTIELEELAVLSRGLDIEHLLVRTKKVRSD